MPQQRLTDRSLAPYITGDTLIHIVNTGDTSQYFGGSSYKATIDQISDYYLNNYDVYITGTTFDSNQAIVTRNDGFDVFKLSGGSNVTLTNPSTNQILIDVVTPPNTNTFVYSGNADVATSTLTFLNTTGGTFTVTNSAALFADNDINVTGGTYNPSTGCVTFTTNSGTTFDVCGFLTGFTSPLSDVLLVGNETQGSDIIMTPGDVIRNQNSSGLGTSILNLNSLFGPSGTWEIESSNGSYLANSPWIYGQPSNGTQIAYQLDDYPGEAIGIGIYNNLSDILNTGKEIVINNNKTSSASTGSSDRRAIFIGSKSSTINSGVVNSVVIGGSNIVANDSNKVYVSSLNIDNILSGTSVINLGLDSSGNVVTGTTGSVSDIYVTGGTYSDGTVTFTNTSGGTFNVSGFTQPFSGGSGNCITDLYITNLYGCSPINVNDETIFNQNVTAQTITIDTGGLIQDNSTIASIDISSGSYSQYNFGTGTSRTSIYQDSDGIQLGATNNGFFGNDSFITVAAGGMWGDNILVQNNSNGNVTNGSGVNSETAIFINSFSSTMLSGVTNSVIIGGSGIIGDTNDTVYVDNLNINTVGSGTSVINLGLDVNGNVVTGTTGGGVNFANADLTFTGNRNHNLSGNYLYIYDALGKDGVGPYLYHNSLQNYISIGHGTDDFIDIGSTGTNTGTTFYTNNISRMVINQNGDIGIGTTTPNYRLDVAGETRLSGSGQNVLTVIGSGDTQPLFTVQGSSGELFTITDSLVGSLFSVNDISGLPILEVFDDYTIHMGNYQAPSLNTTVLLNPGTGLSDVYSIPVSAYTGAFFDYTVLNSTGARAGNIMSIFSGSTVEFSETTTNDIGSTSDVTFTMSNDGSNATLQVSATTTGWEVKTIVRSI